MTFIPISKSRGRVRLFEIKQRNEFALFLPLMYGELDFKNRICCDTVSLLLILQFGESPFYGADTSKRVSLT